MMEWLESKISFLKIGDLELDEDIDNYWESLDDHDILWSYQEEHNARDNLGGMKIVSDETFKKIKNLKNVRDDAPFEGKTLQGVHSYDILANPNYLASF